MGLKEQLELLLQERGGSPAYERMETAHRFLEDLILMNAQNPQGDEIYQQAAEHIAFMLAERYAILSMLEEALASDTKDITENQPDALRTAYAEGIDAGAKMAIEQIIKVYEGTIK